MANGVILAKIEEIEKQVKSLKQLARREVGRRVEFRPTQVHRKALETARKNRVKGRVLTLSELKNKLGFTS
ncbi:hypothetical protein A3A48_04010 [Candidatus Curtissbacteria bacterium RIFCSPLOWO2_01_FULL_37_9]|uniref:Uncharacterized protein n=1 Tax=Candidatus Curtissbacteria bacterium RIFCSPLOWO2_01_FULL_37_9 TaxID=1797724 RepID=A0A1F5GW03_9BACT|nr:MAG: hypothetical protein A3A48_04010 [Candidatus Curtissbacteria bacterium RIFCSPLOWO2_01_FULL_37_9]